MMQCLYKDSPICNYIKKYVAYLLDIFTDEDGIVVIYTAKSWPKVEVRKYIDNSPEYTVKIHDEYDFYNIKFNDFSLPEEYIKQLVCEKGITMSPYTAGEVHAIRFYRFTTVEYWRSVKYQLQAQGKDIYTYEIGE